MGAVTSSMAAKFAFFPLNPPTYEVVEAGGGKLTMTGVGMKENVDVLRLSTKRGNQVAAVYFKNPNASLTLLYSHGNAMDLGQMFDLFSDVVVQDGVVQDFIGSYQNMHVEENRKYVAAINDIKRLTKTSLKEPHVVVTKGKPKKNPTARDPSWYERVEKKLTKSSRGLENGSPRSAGCPPRGCGRASPSPSIRRDHASPSPPLGCGRASPSPPIGCGASRFPYNDCVPTCMLQYIESHVDVIGDDNYGFRSISVGLFGTEDEWSFIRRVMWDHLNSRRDFYQRMVNVYTVMSSLNHFEGSAETRFWMDAIEIGLVFAMAYQVALVVLSERENNWGSYTYLSLTSDLNIRPLDHVVYIAFLQQYKHYIALTIEDGAPMPDIFRSWFHMHDATVEGWERHYVERIAHYYRIHSPKRNDLNVNYLHVNISSSSDC